MQLHITIKHSFIQIFYAVITTYKTYLYTDLLRSYNYKTYLYTDLLSSYNYETYFYTDILHSYNYKTHLGYIPCTQL